MYTIIKFMAYPVCILRSFLLNGILFQKFILSGSFFQFDWLYHDTYRKRMSAEQAMKDDWLSVSWTKLSILKDCLIYLSLDASSLSIVGPVPPLKYYFTVLFERCHFHFCPFYCFSIYIDRYQAQKIDKFSLFQICTILKRHQSTQHAQWQPCCTN